MYYMKYNIFVHIYMYITICSKYFEYFEDFHMKCTLQCLQTATALMKCPVSAMCSSFDANYSR